MPRIAKELSSLEVRRLREPGLHFVGGVPGLCLQVLKSGGQTWILRVRVPGKRRDVGLGGFPGVGLADARRLAREMREKVAKGIDPVEERRDERRRVLAAAASNITFKEACEKYIAAHAPGWTNAKHSEQWRNTLASTYLKIGSLSVRDIDVPQVLSVLEPIWQIRTETASRLRGRIESVLDWATARKHREGSNPARWAGHLDQLLPSPKKIQSRSHFAAVGLAEVGSFCEALTKQPGVGARALELTLLTAARSGEVRGAVWSEFDLEAGVWTVPAARMKAGKEHRVPLSALAITLVKAMPKRSDSPYPFAAPRGGMLSDMSLVAVMRRMKVPAVPHGLRSTFRDWAAERTEFPRDVAEMALAHAIPDKVEAAYRRGDLFAKRRQMMDDWAAFVATVDKPHVTT